MSGSGRLVIRYLIVLACALCTIAGCAFSGGSEPPGSGAEPVATAEGAATICPAGLINLQNAGFDETDLAGSYTLVRSVGGATSAGRSGARDWTVYVDGFGDIETDQSAPPPAGATGGTIRVRVTSSGGVVQVFLAHHTGPSRAQVSARVYVVSGAVTLYAGDGGRAAPVASSTTTGAWEWISGTTSVSPVNELSVYASSPGGAEFFVDEVAAKPEECGLSSTDAWAFLRADETSGSFVPAPTLWASSAGFTPSVAWIGTGLAEVLVPGVGTESGGSIQVNAYGPGNERCKIRDWLEVVDDVKAHVVCTSWNGVPTNTPFSFAYVRKASPSAEPGGYVFADQPSLVGGYVPAPLRQWNSSRGLNVVDWLGTGQYKVRFPGISVTGGTVLVTAHGDGGAHCATGGWSADEVKVYCYDTFGAPSDEQFVLNFSEAWPNLATSYAYAWADNPFAAAYTPTLFYQRNVRGPRGAAFAWPDLTAGWASTGYYFVDIPKAPIKYSNTLVTAYGAPDGRYCKPTIWASLGGFGIRTKVSCFNNVGQPVDSQFDLAYTTF